MEFWRIPKLPDDLTVAICAGGPSMNRADLRTVCRDENTAVIGINNVAFMAHEIGETLWMHYFCDPKWFEWHGDSDAYQNMRARHRVTLGAADLPETRLKRLRALGMDGWEPFTRDGIYAGRNSGYQCLYIALMTGCARVLLLGYDMRHVDREAHWHDAHPAGNPQPHTLERFKEMVALLAPVALDCGIDVVNVTPESALTAFRRSTLEQELQDDYKARRPAGVSDTRR